MYSIEQRLQSTREKLAYMKSKENIQTILKENPAQLKHLAIEEEILKNLIATRQRKVASTLDLGFNLFAVCLFTFLTVMAICFFNYGNFSNLTWEQQGTELAVQLGLIVFSTLTFLLFFSNSKQRVRAARIG